MGIQHPKKTLAFDPEKASLLLEELVSVYQKYSPSVGEIIAATSNLLYSLGSSISEFYGVKYEDNVGPNLEELNRIYYSEPGRLDVAMMLSGLTMSTWYENWESIQTNNINKKLEEDK